MKHRDETIFLSPHNDDSVLFGSFHLLRDDPLVVTCFRSHVQELRGTGITAATREAEDVEAFRILGISEFRQWSHPDSLSAEGAYEILRAPFRGLADAHPAATVWAPAVEEGGHDQHTVVGELAGAFWPHDQVRRYLTYRRGHGRTQGRLVEFEPDWPARKLAALSCYGSQIAEPSTRDWFLGEQWEYVPIEATASPFPAPTMVEVGGPAT